MNEHPEARLAPPRHPRVAVLPRFLLPRKTDVSPQGKRSLRQEAERKCGDSRKNPAATGAMKIKT